MIWEGAEENNKAGVGVGVGSFPEKESHWDIYGCPCLPPSSPTAWRSPSHGAFFSFQISDKALRSAPAWHLEACAHQALYEST